MRSRSSEATLPLEAEEPASPTTPSVPTTTMSTEQGTEVAALVGELALHELALQEFEQEHYDAALDCWAKALGQQEDPDQQATILWNLVKLHLEMSLQQPTLTQEQHLRAAELHFDNLRPHLSKVELDRPTHAALEFLVQHGEWEASRQAAETLRVPPAVVARISFQESLDCRGMEEKVDCLERCLSHKPDGKLRRDALMALMEAHTELGNYERALEVLEQAAAEDKEASRSKFDKAHFCYRRAEILAALGRTQEAFDTIQDGLSVLPKAPSLLQAKADLYFLLDKVSDSLATYETVLSLTKSPLDQSKILYTMGRIVHKRGQPHRAAKYYCRELAVTQKAFGAHHLECSRIHHELAVVYEELCQFPQAIASCQKALEVEKLHHDAARPKSAQRKELRELVVESQHKMGRLYFKQGDFGKAVQTSFAE